MPTEITLSSREARQTLVVQRQDGEQFQEQVPAAEVKLQSSDEMVVRIEEGVAIPVANGTATITATAGEQTATAKVVVSNQDQPFHWSFRNHVESVLSKQGCNAGSCHGARAGQKGFRLTLFGFDVDADYTYLTRQAVGRRIVPSDPGRSLILTKPSGLLPHKGGVKLETGSLEYRESNLFGRGKQIGATLMFSRNKARLRSQLQRSLRWRAQFLECRHL